MPKSDEARAMEQVAKELSKLQLPVRKIARDIGRIRQIEEIRARTVDGVRIPRENPQEFKFELSDD